MCAFTLAVDATVCLYSTNPASQATLQDHAVAYATDSAVVLSVPGGGEARLERHACALVLGVPAASLQCEVGDWCQI